MAADAYAELLEREKAQSTLQLLFKAARLLNERAVAQVRRRTRQPLRSVHTSLLPHVALEGTRLTELAQRLGVSKQAAGQLVDDLVAMGTLERAPDPTDARAKLVRFSKRGRAAMLEGLGVLGELEREMRDTLGETKLRSLHAMLAAIVGNELAKGGATEDSQ